MCIRDRIIDAVATLDPERETHFLPQPIFVQGQCRDVVGLDGDRPAVRATAHSLAMAVAPNLRPMLLAVGAEYELRIQRRRFDRLAESGQCGRLTQRKCRAQHRHAAGEQPADQGPGIMPRHRLVL